MSNNNITLNADLQYFEWGGVEPVGLFHHHLVSLAKDIVPDVLLVGGQVVLDASGVAPLVLA